MKILHSSVSVALAAIAALGAPSRSANLPVEFESNRGQAQTGVVFLARSPVHTNGVYKSVNSGQRDAGAAKPSVR